MSSSPDQRHAPLALVILISGRGSNLKAIIDAIDRGELPAVIRAVVSNRRVAPGLATAARAGITTTVIDPTECGGRAAFDRALLQRVDGLRPDLVVLAGFMHILDPEFVRAFDGRLINIHPSLLPAYRGLHTHRRALEDGAREHGASVHFVTGELDGGPVVLRGKVPVLPRDDAASLAARVLKMEHRIYPLVIRWFAEGRLRKRGDRVLLDGRVLDSPVEFEVVESTGDALGTNGGKPDP
jgi:phosphoribosylglycinamide formyltransferase 1